MKRILIMLAVFSLLLVGSSSAATTCGSLVDQGPLFGMGSLKTYYPTVVKDSSVYRMWYGSGSGCGYATSTDGSTWTQQTNPLSGLQNCNHPLVEKIGGTFHIWYWDQNVLYSPSAIRHATSTDGINWANDQPLTGSIVSGIYPNWNYGSYGPIDLIYNPTATNTGANPFDYTYALYFDVTPDGGSEEIGLAYSSDGINFQGYGTVLPRGNTGPWGNTDNWDSSYTTFGTVIKLSNGNWKMWYSGGTTESNHGIGVATSTDGLNWVRDPNNPLMHITDGVAYRQERTYTPAVIFDSGALRMWYTCRGDGSAYGGTSSGDYMICGTAPAQCCTDNDNDGYSVEGGSCGSIDCSDNNPGVNPGANEICGNSLDDNCNTQVDEGCCLPVIEGIQPGNTGLKAIDTKCCVTGTAGNYKYDDPDPYAEDSPGDYQSCVALEANIQGFTGRTNPSKGQISSTAAKSNINMPAGSNSPIGPTGFTTGIGATGGMSNLLVGFIVILVLAGLALINRKK